LKLSNYIAPLESERESTKLGWLREALSESRSTHEKLPGWSELDADLELISRSRPSFDPSNLSWLNIGNTKARIGDVVSTLSNLRPLWEITTGVKELQPTAKVLNKCSWGWWSKTDADLKILAALQWSAVNRTGYLWVRWDKHYHGLNQGDIDCIPLGPKSVYFLYLPEDHNYQKAYATIICESVPITQAMAENPLYASQLKPSAEADGIVRRFTAPIVKGAQALWDGDMGKSAASQSTPHVNIYHAYVRDLTLNHTNHMVSIGDPSTKWFYEVPYIGQSVPSGFVSPATAQDVMRKAREEDCYLYPNRRLVSFTDTCVLYDGPSREYHGLAPVIKFTLDPWPWDFLGGSMVRDVRSIDETINERLRGINKSAEMRRNPPKMVDEDLIADSEQPDISKIVDTNIGEPGQTVKCDFKKGDPIRAILPYQNYDVQSWEFEYLKFLDFKADFILGRAQMEALALARQMPAGDTQEKWLQATGSRTTAKSRNMERSLKSLGFMVACNMLQWYDAPLRFSLYGFQGVVQQDFDYDPNSMIPDNLSFRSGTFAIDARSEIYKYRYQRARAITRMIALDIEPMSVHEMTSMTRGLLQTRLYEGGKFPIDSWTLADTLKISNMGDPPETPDDTMPERFVVEQEARGKVGAMIQAQAQAILMQANPQAVIQQAIQENPQGVLQMVLAAIQAKGGVAGNPTNGGSSGGGSNGATGNPEGRPPSYQEPPQLFQRSDGQGGQRDVLSTSDRG